MQIAYVIYANNCIALSLHLPFKGWDIASLIWFGGGIKGHLKPKWDGQVLAGTTSTAVLCYQRSLIRPIVSGREGISIERTHEYYQVVGNLLKPWLPFELNPGAQKAGLQALKPLGSKKKEEKNGKQGRGKVYHGQGLKGEDPLNSWFLIRLKWTARMAAVLFPGLITFHCTCLMSQLFLSLNNSTSPWLLHPPQTLSLLFAHLFQLGWGETEREKRERLPFMAYVWKLAAADSVELWLWNRTPKQSGNASGGELHFKFRFTHKLISSKFQIWGKNDLENFSYLCQWFLTWETMQFQFCFVKLATFKNDDNDNNK